MALYGDGPPIKYEPLPGTTVPEATPEELKTAHNKRMSPITTKYPSVHDVDNVELEWYTLLGGLPQLLPQTAKYLGDMWFGGEDRFDPDDLYTSRTHARKIGLATQKHPVEQVLRSVALGNTTDPLFGTLDRAKQRWNNLYDKYIK